MGSLCGLLISGFDGTKISAQPIPWDFTLKEDMKHG